MVTLTIEEQKLYEMAIMENKNFKEDYQDCAYDTLNVYAQLEYQKDFYELESAERLAIADKLKKAIDIVSNYNPNEQEMFFNKLYTTREKYDTIPDKILDNIVAYINENQDVNPQILAKEIKNKFDYDIESKDIEYYLRVAKS